MTFPTTPILDTFDSGALQALSARAGWNATGHYIGGDVDFQTDAGPTFANEALGRPCSNVWGTSFGPDCEVWFTYGTNHDGFRIFARADVPSPTPTTAYVLQTTFNGTGNLIGTRGGATLVTFNTVTPVSGDQWGLQVIGTTLNAWQRLAGGSWTIVATTTSALFNTAGYIGMFNGTGNVTNVMEFGGGTYVPGTSHFLSSTGVGS